MRDAIVAGLYALAGALFVAAALVVSASLGLAVAGVCVLGWTVRVFEAGE